MRLLIVIPAFNESKIIGDVLKGLPKRLDGIGSIDTIVIDDGSLDNTAEIASNYNVIIVRHAINRGAGAATKTGLEYARINNYDTVVTFDADGQHDPKDIQKVLGPILSQGADLVVGSRLKTSQEMPFDRLILNWVANITTLIFFGVLSTDSQSGLKAFSKKAISAINIKSDKMEFSSEILLEAKRNRLKISEVATRAIYTDYSLTKGQKNSNAIPVFIRMLTHLLR